MFTIEDNEMTIYKGDTGIFDFKLDNYTLTDGDNIYFTVKKTIDDPVYVFQKLENTFIEGVAKFTITQEDTNIAPGNYIYDIQASLQDGRIDTVIPPSKFKILKGVTD